MDKVHRLIISQLFYSKRSQFVSGVEAEKVTVSVGQRVCFVYSSTKLHSVDSLQQAINERIKELDIQDCKVRVSNVDSQESYRNLVVQVIGEMSNKAAPHRKFVQTFVLAEQPNGYFVLNDIFRYINEEEEEIEPEPLAESETPAPAVPEAEVKTLSSSDDLAAQQYDAEQVDKKLEEQVAVAQGSQDEDAADAPTTNGVSIPVTAEADVTEDTPAADIVQSEDQPEAGTAPDTTETDVAVEVVEQEKPKDPDPTPVASPPKPASATSVQAPTPAAPPKPAAPKTWANLVAANRIAPPAVPSPASSTSPAPSQPKAAPALPKQATTPPTPASEDFPNQAQQGSGAEWQTAGQENGKRQGRGQSVSAVGDNQNVLGYVKNVTDKVDASILKNTLLQYGKLAYFDVSRQKVCTCLRPQEPQEQLLIDDLTELCLCRIRRCRWLQCCRRRQPPLHWG